MFHLYNKCHVPKLNLLLLSASPFISANSFIVYSVVQPRNLGVIFNSSLLSTPMSRQASCLADQFYLSIVSYVYPHSYQVGLGIAPPLELKLHKGRHICLCYSLPSASLKCSIQSSNRWMLYLVILPQTSLYPPSAIPPESSL